MLRFVSLDAYGALGRVLELSLKGLGPTHNSFTGD